MAPKQTPSQTVGPVLRLRPHGAAIRLRLHRHRLGRPRRRPVPGERIRIVGRVLDGAGDADHRRHDRDLAGRCAGPLRASGRPAHGNSNRLSRLRPLRHRAPTRTAASSSTPSSRARRRRAGAAHQRHRLHARHAAPRLSRASTSPTRRRRMPAIRCSRVVPEERRDTLIAKREDTPAAPSTASTSSCRATRRRCSSMSRAIPDEADPPRIATSSAHREEIALLQMMRAALSERDRRLRSRPFGCCSSGSNQTKGSLRLVPREPLNL